MALDVGDVLRFLGRFDRLAKALTRRSRGKQQFELVDEYDVQDLVFAALKPIVDDLTTENPYPKVATVSGRVDVVSSSMGLVVEIKATLKEGRAEKIPRECMERIKLYSAVPDIQFLAFFIYDPDGKIDDIDNVQRDLQGLHHRQDRSGDFDVLVVGSGLPVPSPVRAKAEDTLPVQLHIDEVKPYYPGLGVLMGVTVDVPAGITVNGAALRLGSTEVPATEPPEALTDSVASHLIPAAGIPGPTKRNLVLHFGVGRAGVGVPAKYGSSGFLELRHGVTVVARAIVDLPESSPVPISDADGCNVLASWFYALSEDKRRSAVSFVDADTALSLPSGTAKRLLAQAISGGHEVASEGDATIVFKRRPLAVPVISRSQFERGGF